MSKQVYDWKRFWCPRTSSIGLADGGYLSDPDAEWGKSYKQNLVTLEEVADIPCLVLLGEPGIGKSREMVELSRHTNKFINEEDQILFLDIENYNEQKIHSDLFESEEFTNWINSTDWLYLFIDSFEQGWLTCQNLPKLLTNEFEKLDKVPKSKPLKPIIYLHLALKTGFLQISRLNRLHIRIACRAFTFSAVESVFKGLWGNRMLVYDLFPLS